MPLQVNVRPFTNDLTIIDYLKKTYFIFNYQIDRSQHFKSKLGSEKLFWSQLDRKVFY